MNHWEWEGMALKKTFPLTSSQKCDRLGAVEDSPALSENSLLFTSVSQFLLILAKRKSQHHFRRILQFH